MKKILSVMLSIAMIFSIFSTTAMATTKATSNDEWDTSRYGDIMDIGPKIRHQDKDENFRNKLDNEIKQMATNTNFSQNLEMQSENINFTYNGGTKKFLGHDIDGYYFKDFTLRSLGDDVEIWVADDLSYPDDRPADVITQEQVDKLRDEFDNNIYIKDTEFFGMHDSHTGENALLIEWGNVPEGYYDPIDGIERVIILVDNIRDEKYYDIEYPFFIAGFYSGTYEGYFDRNIINIDTNNWEERLENTFFGTTAHEFQHLIHDDNDSHEETWINEGMSDFAEFLCGYGHPMRHVNFFLDHPENSLVEWDDHYDAETGPETLSDYGQAYLLQLYLYDHYGRDFIQSLAKDEDHGFTSVNKILEEYDTGIDFEELFRRFSIAVAIDSPWVAFDNTWFKSNFGQEFNSFNGFEAFDKDFNINSHKELNKQLKNLKFKDFEKDFESLCIQDGIYNFDSIDIGVSFESAKEYDKDGVPAWGGDYKILEEAYKILSIKFDGIEFMPTPWKVVDNPINTGNEVLWGNTGNESDKQIILKADLTEVDAATLKFDNYIDIEEQWDFGMVQVSTDNGETWVSLSNDNTRSDIVEEGYPEIKENLPGFTGKYEEWTKEEFDLTPYAGENILIGFRYMTDWGTNEAGWYVDNIEIPEIGINNDCSSTEDFYSINEILETRVDYAVTFINKIPFGNENIYSVKSLDPFNVSEEEATELRELFMLGDNYMIVWYAAPDGQTGIADYTYEILYWDQLKNQMKRIIKN